jgi:ribosomal-protein-alanine N-acetyltransferase
MVTIRSFSPTDIPAIMKVVKDSLGENYPPSLYLTVHNLFPEGFLVLKDQGHIVAFVATIEAKPKVARVLMLAVMPQHRRKSFGRRLMNELYVHCLARGFSSVVLEVRKSNVNAIAFYEQQGFDITGEIGNFYMNGEDAFTMMKVLQS